MDLFIWSCFPKADLFSMRRQNQVFEPAKLRTKPKNDGEHRERYTAWGSTGSLSSLSALGLSQCLPLSLPSPSFSPHSSLLKFFPWLWSVTFFLAPLTIASLLPLLVVLSSLWHHQGGAYKYLWDRTREGSFSNTDVPQALGLTWRCICLSFLALLLPARCHTWPLFSLILVLPSVLENSKHESHNKQEVA